MLSTGSEHKGQTSISDLDQNLGFTCIFSSDNQENTFTYLNIYNFYIISVIKEEPTNNNLNSKDILLELDTNHIENIENNLSDAAFSDDDEEEVPISRLINTLHAGYCRFRNFCLTFISRIFRFRIIPDFLNSGTTN